MCHNPLAVQNIKIPASIKPHALVAKSMLVSKIMVTLALTSKYFYCFEGNVGNMLHAMTPIVCEIPPGVGEGRSLASQKCI